MCFVPDMFSLRLYLFLMFTVGSIPGPVGWTWFSLVASHYFALGLSSVDFDLALTYLNHSFYTIFGKSSNLPSLDLASTSGNSSSITGQQFQPNEQHIRCDLIINRTELNGLNFLCSFFHLFIQHLLSTYCMLGRMLRIRNTEINKGGHVFSSIGTHSLAEGSVLHR